MKRIILITALVLSGCATSVPIAVKFPDVPKDMLVACPDLNQIPDTTKLSEVLPVVADNYGQYYTCKDNVDSWIEWYTAQQKIFNSIK
jgi:hypothetical protein